jgi:CRP-like cAMP-binding protein
MYVPGSSALGATDMTPLGLSPEDKAEMLERTSWSQAFNWEQILTLAGYMQAVRLRAEGTVFREHDRKAYMCLLVTGEVAVLKEGVEGGQKQLTNLGAGKAFGELALLDSQPRSATIVATADSTLMVLTLDALQQLSEEQPTVANLVLWKLARVVSGRLRQTSGALIEHL